MTNGVTFDPRAALIRRTIRGKSVVSFESHHYALLPWSEWRQEVGRPLRLLSIDFHTDTHDAFQYYAYYARDKTPNGRQRPFAKQDEAARLAQLSIDDPASIDNAVHDLRHDEHIDVALKCGILEVAFILAHKTNEALEPVELETWRERNSHVLSHLREPRPVEPFTYEFPRDRMVTLGVQALRQGDDAERHFRSQVIEAEFLRSRLEQAADICRSAGKGDLLNAPLILDIDLDAFNTRQAIAPQDPSVFYELIRQAHAITIAQEPKCVEECQIEGEGLTAPWLEEQLMAHIERALP